MHCPLCREAFEPSHEGLFEDILVHRCSGCGVLWLHPESLDRLDENVSIDASRIEWEVTDDAGGLQCPECIGTYRTAGPTLCVVRLPATPGIVAHRCEVCRSFLLDANALDRIRRFVVARP